MLNQDMEIYSNENPIFIYKKDNIYEPIFYKSGRDFEKNDCNLNISRNETINMIILYIKTKTHACSIYQLSFSYYFPFEV